MDSTVFQIIDVNLNRTREGLRVVEEIARFILRDESLTKKIKTQRHRLAKLFKDIPLLNHRDTSKDLGRNADFDTYTYKKVSEIAKRNLKRAQEGCRAIEEFSKLLDAGISKTIKEIRFITYDIEKDMERRLSVSCKKDMNRELGNRKLYVILDEKYIIEKQGKKALPTRSLEDIVTALCEGGAQIIQFRAKKIDDKDFLLNAIKIKEITAKFNVPFIINDRLDITLLSNADGLHIGETDIPVKEARKILPDSIIGASVSSVKKAIKAYEDGADYLGVGCLFSSGTKTDAQPAPLTLISDIRKAVKVPVFGIGGITIDKIGKVLTAGADGVCIAGDIFNYPDIKKRVKEIKNKLKNAKT